MAKDSDSGNSAQMSEIASGLPSKSAKIRKLDEAGYSRSEIAKFLNIRYQHVRNVLVGPKPKDEVGQIDLNRAEAADHRRKMSGIVEGLPTKAAKIRALLRQGYRRTEIAKFLGVRYQHVYNVEIRSGLDEDSAKFNAAGDENWVRVEPDGNIHLSVEYRRALGLEQGGEVQLHLEGDELRIIPREAVIRRVRDRVRKYVPEGINLVDDLIADRRREADEQDA